MFSAKADHETLVASQCIEQNPTTEPQDLEGAVSLVLVVEWQGDQSEALEAAVLRAKSSHMLNVNGGLEEHYTPD